MCILKKIFIIITVLLFSINFMNISLISQTLEEDNNKTDAELLEDSIIDKQNEELLGILEEIYVLLLSIILYKH